MRELCSIRQQKKETHRKILATGRNIIDHPGDVRTPTSDLTIMKLHINSAISNVKSSYMCMDVKCFYLNNMIMIQIAMIPQVFVDKYNLQEKSHNGYIYVRVANGMYGIP